MARACMAKSAAYVKQHAKARAEVLPIVGQLVRDAEHASAPRVGSPHWCLTDLAKPPSWDIQRYGDYSLNWCTLAVHHGDFISAR